MFEVGQVYNRRRDIHEVYGGQQQGGICTPTHCPYIFLFTGESGAENGYEDRWLQDGTFSYTGEGQFGDMQLVRGNRAIRDHLRDGKSLLLFEDVYSDQPGRDGRRRKIPGQRRFVGEMVCIGYHPEERPDREGTLRQAIVFELQSLESQDQLGTGRDPHADLAGLTLDQLRVRAQGQEPRVATREERQRTYRLRSAAVKLYALARAGGCCEACGLNAPFVTPSDQPFLEVHHIDRMADGGPDSPHAVAGVCPNCHRRLHHGADAAAYNELLRALVTRKEASLLEGSRT